MPPELTTGPPERLPAPPPPQPAEPPPVLTGEAAAVLAAANPQPVADDPYETSPQEGGH